MSASGEYSRHIGQVYQSYNARLRGNFISLLGDEAEADECVQETLRHFFFFLKDRCWESEAESMDVYVMRIAGAVCSRRLARKNVPPTNARRKESLLNRLGRGLLKPVRIGTALKHLFPETFGDAGHQSLRQLSAVR